MRKKHCKRRRQGQACKFAETGSRPLCEYPDGTLVRIADISGCSKARCRLLAMGLTPGTTVEISTNSCGACCLKVRDSDLVLGNGMSEMVMACPASDNDPHSTRGNQ